MANTEPVKVAVEIIDSFSKELKELETRLEKIDGKTLNIDLDIDDGRLEEIEGRLEALEDDINATLDIDVSGYGSAKAQKEELEDDMHSTLHIGVDKDRLRGLGNLNGGEGFNPPSGSGSIASLTGLESLDLADDVLDHTLENLRGFEGSSVEYADSVRRFTPEEQDYINDWIINPGVARLHNNIPADQRDGWIGPSNWGFGVGEMWGPEPRYPGDKKPIDAQTDFLRGIREMTDSWSDLEGSGPNFDADEISLGIETGLGKSNSDRNYAEIDFLRSINRATSRASSFEIFDDSMYPKAPSIDMRRLNWDAQIGPTPFGDLPFIERARFRGNRVGSRAGRAVSSGLGTIGRLASDGFDMLTDEDGNRSPAIRGLKKGIKQLLPSMHRWYQLIALILPLLITMAGAALGAAAAFGALATAGVAMAGIGLLGWGDSVTESLNNVKRRINQLKKELFDVLRPVAGVFQPFTAQLFDAIPGMVGNLTEPLKALEETGYDDWWLGALSEISEWFAELLWAASDLAPEIQAIGSAFGEAFGDGIINLLRWATLELYENWGAFARLGAIIVDLLLIIYNLSKAVSFALSFFKPLFDIFTAISNVVGSRMTSAILAAVAAMFSLYYIGSSVAAMLAAIKALAIAQAFWTAVTAVGSLMGALGALSGVLSVILAKMLSLNLLTGGLLLAAGLVVGGIAYKSMGSAGSASESLGGGNVPASGFGRSSPAPAGAGGGTQIIFNGPVGDKEYQRLKDEFPDMYEEERTIEQETEK